MHRPLVPVLSLTLLGCATTLPVQPVPSPAVSTRAAPLPSLDLRVASLPARPAGAAFAMAGAEHAVVRLPAPASTPAAPMPAMAGPPLAAHVLEVQAAYLRWCDGTALPGDAALLASGSGLRLPEAVACAPPPTAAEGKPRPLIPARQ